MAIDFPTSPTNGQTLTSGTTKYIFDSASGVWNAFPLVAGTALPFNYFINPYMRIVQEVSSVNQGSGGSAGSSTTHYPADQWIATWVWANCLAGTAIQSQASGNELYLQQGSFAP